ncbi:MAG TPA: c-type cytochrome [Candidatus Acidoferrales bacterium]|nr:c-type cytochrome [Candidatus Acidoferrales bacterium]
MRRIFLFFGLMGHLVVAGCGGSGTARQTAVERGKYLVAFGGCHDCHSPKVEGPGGIPLPDTTRLLSGHPEKLPPPVWTPAAGQQHDTIASTNSMMTAWAGPWGVSFAMNLTPDKETGLGEWSEETFIRAMRTGKHQGQPNGRDILPPMPWFNVKQLSDDDLKAVWAYLQSLPAIKNHVPFPIPPDNTKPAEAAQSR